MKKLGFLLFGIGLAIVFYYGAVFETRVVVGAERLQNPVLVQDRADGLAFGAVAAAIGLLMAVLALRTERVARAARDQAATAEMVPPPRMGKAPARMSAAPDTVPDAFFGGDDEPDDEVDGVVDRQGFSR